MEITTAAREAALRILATQLPVAVWSVDSEMRVLSVFGAALNSLKIQPEQVTGRSLSDLIDALGIDPFLLSAHQQALRGENVVYLLEWGDRVFEYALEPLRNSAGGIQGVVGIALDKTDRTRAETALRESEERYRTLAQLSPVGMFHCDAEGLFTYVNEQWTALTGLRLEKSKGREWQAALHPLDREWVLAAFRQALQLGDPFEAEFRFRRPDGSVSWVLARALPERAAGGLVVGTIGTVTNITDRKEAEELLAFRQKLLARAAKGVSAEQLFESMVLLLEVESNGGRGILWVSSDPDTAPAAFTASLSQDLAEDLRIFLTARSKRDGKPASPRPEYLSLAGFSRQRPGALLDWLGLGGMAVAALSTPNGAWGWIALVYPSEDPASAFDCNLLESANELVTLVLERRHQEKIDRLNEELFTQNRSILEASRMKTEFMARMSHELRTPLNAIIGFSQLLLDQRTGPVSPKQHEFLSDVLQSGMHLLRIINDLLDLAKIEAGKVEVRLEPVTVDDLVAEVRDVLRPLSAQKGFTVELTSHLNPPEAFLDAQRFRQILYNLLSNAIKFTPVNGENVSVVCAWREPGVLELQVRDHGIGIKPEDVSKLFQPFQQLESELPVTTAGSGLGLAICRQLAELHRGYIEVRSENRGGSVFTVVFPFAAVPIPA